MRVLVVADTHAPSRWRGIPRGLAGALASGVDLILHAGDVCRPEVLGALRQYAPVRAVLGNNDGPDLRAWGATPWYEESLDGLDVAMIHDAGERTGRAARMRRRFPEASLVVFGHSHSPWNALDHRTGLHLFNPGSVTDPRREPFGTFGVLTIESGHLVASHLLRADGDAS
jgi:uncharacterized protein